MTMLNLWNYKPLTQSFFDDSHDTSWERSFVPPCDIEEKESAFLISLDVPGLKKEDIQIELENDILKVSGERKEERKTTEKGFLKSERFTGKFYRAFSLGETVNAKSIEASYEEGVLRLLVPKEKEVKPEVIKIKVGEKLPDTH